MSAVKSDEWQVAGQNRPGDLAAPGSSCLPLVTTHLPLSFGQRLAYVYNSSVYYYRGDPIGSSRGVTWSIGTLCQDSDYTPFGSEIVHLSSCSQNYKFAAMERDAETGNDHTQFRQYASNFCRWLSPDPSGGHLEDPQTLNKYAYVRDNPTTLTDPTGLDIWLRGDKDCKKTGKCDKKGYLLDDNGKRVHLHGDKRQIATLGPHGISVKYGGETYQGVWDTNNGEDKPVDIAGAGALSPFVFEATGSHNNPVQGMLYNVSGFGTDKQMQASAGQVLNALSGKDNGYVIDYIDPLHGLNTRNFRGHSDSDPDLLPSTHVPVPLKPGKAMGEIHVDSTYPYDS